MADRLLRLGALLGLLGLVEVKGAEGPSPTLAREVFPVLKARCVKCHGPAKR